MSVVIPAHNEERTIARLLDMLISGDPDGDLDILVVPNGCTDRTAEVARAAGSRVRVLELEAGDKIAALNAADVEAGDLFPRAYVDADAEVSAAALLALVEPLSKPGARVTAAPRQRLDTTGASVLSRLYHRVWARTLYQVQGPIGGGVFVLSRAAREYFKEFPPVMDDDLYVLRLADDCGTRLIDEDHTFVFHAPRRVRPLLARLTRATVGNLQLERQYGLSARTAGGGKYLLRTVATTPSLWPAFPVYMALRLLAEVGARRRLSVGDLRWTSDSSTR